jgi:serine/threonine protein kinase
LHWRACQECNNILKIFDIYENKINSVKSLCIITELMEGGEFFDKIVNKKEPFTEQGRLKFNIHTIIIFINEYFYIFLNRSSKIHVSNL